MKNTNLHRLDGEKKIKLFCEMRIPNKFKDKMKITYEIKRNRILIFEEQPSCFRPGRWTKHSIVQIRYLNKRKYWILYWRDRNSKWHLYEELKPQKKIEEIIKEIKTDPTGIFWG